MSMLSKAMGWDQIKEDASMMKGQGQELMGYASDMFGRGKGFLTGKGDWYDNAMQSFGRTHMDAAGATGRNITQNFAAKGAGGGFASLINQNIGSQQRLGEASSGFFSGLYRQGAEIGANLQRSSQGFTGQATQAMSKGADLSKSHSDIATGLLNSTIGLAGGLGMQSLANKGAMGIANTMMGNPASAAASSKPGLLKRGLGLLGFGGNNNPTNMPMPNMDYINQRVSQLKGAINPMDMLGNNPMQRFSLDNTRNEGPRNMLPGGWMREITDWQDWKSKNRGFEPPEPGAGNYSSWQNR